MLCLLTVFLLSIDDVNALDRCLISFLVLASWRLQIESARWDQLHMEQLLLQKKAKTDGDENLTCVLLNWQASNPLSKIHLYVNKLRHTSTVTIIIHLILQDCSLRHGIGQ